MTGITGAVSVEERLAAAGFVLEEAIPPIGPYAPVTLDGGLAYTAGIVALTPAFELVFPGAVGAEVSPEDAVEASRGAMLCALANLKAELGTLDQVQRAVKFVGYVNAAPGFVAISPVLNGASEVLDTAFGADVRPVRTAIGVSALPGGASVEIDCVFRLR
jgi:enamine deaminase RidA (YjgF/YER057c/UK114 family)